MPSRSKGRSLRLAALVAALPIVASAVTPVTPHLAPESRQALSKSLAANAFPENARNSVFIALGQGLGMTPRKTTYRYEMPQAHLPVIDVDVTPASERCAQVILSAKFAAQAKYGPTTVRGRYCLTGVGEWTAEEQHVSH